MSKAVVYMGREREWRLDEEVTHVTVAFWVTEIKQQAFGGCKGLTNLSFLKGSAITTVGDGAFERSGISTLQGMEVSSASASSPSAWTCAPSRACAARRWATAASTIAPCCSR
jgi:hypothetical protein